MLKCDEDVLVGMTAARQALLKAFADAEGQEIDGKNALHILHDKASTLKSMDPCIGIEIAALQRIFSDGGEELMTKRILDLMPNNKEAALALPTVCDKLSCIVGGPVYTFANEKAKSFADIALQTLRDMQGGEAPNIAKLMQGVGPFWAAFVQRLPWLASCTVVVEQGPDIVVFGLSALAARLAKCTKAHGEDCLTCKLLNELHVFEHWLDENQKKAVKTLTDHLFGNLAAKKKAPQAKATASKGSLARARRKPPKRRRPPMS